MIKKLITSLLVCLCLICLTTPKAIAKEPVNTHVVKGDIVRTALEFGVDPYIVLSIAKLESGYNHTKKNPSGAVGVFQLMPRTAKLLGVNPYLREDNIKGGVLYYKQMYKKYGSIDLALAAYNAGPGNVRKYNGIPPFKETRAFVSKVKKEYNVLKANKVAEQYITKQEKEITPVFKDVSNVIPSKTLDLTSQAEAI
ncbi:MAG: lytic transglycosylase domain-containing protein [Cyanobacteria bacterium SIG30]|nr:lytic transglycosylase domain-containing protein [Cyanobacteria bacterium SIG30]